MGTPERGETIVGDHYNILPLFLLHTLLHFLPLLPLSIPTPTWLPLIFTPSGYAYSLFLPLLWHPASTPAIPYSGGPGPPFPLEILTYPAMTDVPALQH